MKLSVMFIALLFLAACGGGSETVDKDDFNAGGKGVTVEFLKDRPKDAVREEAGFEVGIQIRNEGFTDIAEGELALAFSGCENVKFMDGPKQDLELKRNDEMYPGGEADQMILTANALKEEPKCPLQAIVCYRYSTQASVDVCIDNNPNSQSPNKICEASDYTLPAQGAPIIVEKVETSYSGDDSQFISFNIFIRNTGGGRPQASTYWNMGCTEPPDEDHHDIVGVDALIGDQPLDCQGSEEDGAAFVKMVDKKESKYQNYFTCSYPIDPQRGTYTTPLVIRLYYGYRQITTKTIEIQDTVNQEGEEKEKCPEDHCFNPGVWGVCDEVYGGENKKLTCEGDDKCCIEAESECVRKYGDENFSCNKKSDCIQNNIKSNLCPGNDVCCKT